MMADSRAGQTIAIESATKRFGAVTALHDVSLTVAAGRFVVLLGPSGSGKSTLLRCVAGIERLTSGRILMADQVVDDGRYSLPPERRHLAMVFQDYALWPHMTAEQNVAYALRRFGLDRAKASSAAREMLARVGLDALAGRYPSELSGGEQQRVALARALVGRPGLVLFDEPLSNLDANLREKMRVEIALLVRDAGASALYITHDQAEAFALADDVGILNHGQLEQFDTPEGIYRSPASPFVARLTGLAAELPAEVLSPPNDGVASVRVLGSEHLARCPRPLDGGSPRVLVRPSSIRVLPPHSSGLHGTVVDAAFEGRGYQHTVDLPGGHRISGVFAEERYDRDSNIALEFDPAGCLLFDAEE